MPVPTNPYNCIGFTLYNLTMKYDRSNFTTPANLKTAKESIDNILSNITEFESQDLNGADFPQLSIADFCADVPYKEISCRVQDGVAICEDDRPAIQVSAPRIILPTPPPVNGKIQAGFTVVISSNVQAAGFMECLVDGNWVKSPSSIGTVSNEQGGTDFIVLVKGCVIIPDDGLDCRFTACDNCCNDKGEFEQNCDSITFKVFPCITSEDENAKVKRGWFETVTYCNPTTAPTFGFFCNDNLSAHYSLGLSDNIVTEPLYETRTMYFALPSDLLCKDFTVENLTGCTGNKSGMEIVEVSQAEIETLHLGEYMLSELGADAQKVKFYSLTVNSVNADCTLTYLSTNVCGGTFQLIIPIKKLLCEDIISKDKDCIPAIVTGGVLNFNFSADYEFFILSTCPQVRLKYKLTDLVTNQVLDTSNTLRAVTFDANYLTSLGIALPASLRVDYEYPNTACPPTSVLLNLTGSITATSLYYNSNVGGVSGAFQACLSGTPAPPDIQYLGTGTMSLTTCNTGALLNRKFLFSLKDTNGASVAFTSWTVERINADSSVTPIASGSGLLASGQETPFNENDTSNYPNNSYRITWNAGASTGVGFFNFNK